MSKRNKIIYWVTTAFLAFGMLAGGIQQMLQIGGYNDIVTQLGYPLYMLSILGTWKILGVIALLVPKDLYKRMGLCRLFLCDVRCPISHMP